MENEDFCDESKGSRWRENTETSVRERNIADEEFEDIDGQPLDLEADYSLNKTPERQDNQLSYDSRSREDWKGDHAESRDRENVRSPRRDHDEYRDRSDDLDRKSRSRGYGHGTAETSQRSHRYHRSRSRDREREHDANTDRQNVTRDSERSRDRERSRDYDRRSRRGDERDISEHRSRRRSRSRDRERDRGDRRHRDSDRERRYRDSYRDRPRGSRDYEYDRERRARDEDSPRGVPWVPPPLPEYLRPQQVQLFMTPVEKSQQTPGVSSWGAMQTTPAVQNQFQNDGSFMEMFRQKMQQSAGTSTTPAAASESHAASTSFPSTAPVEVAGPSTAATPSSLPANSSGLPVIAKRRISKILKTGVVQKKKKEEEEETGEKDGDGGTNYMKEVQKYRANKCIENEASRPPLVK